MNVNIMNLNRMLLTLLLLKTQKKNKTSEFTNNETIQRYSINKA